MQRIRCKFCHAKPRVQFAVNYGGHDICAECKYEYQSIFEGKLSKTAESKLDGYNPLFEAFKRGWQETERKQGLDPLPIPDSVKNYYSELFDLSIKSDQDETLLSYVQYTEAVYKRILTHERNKNGISKDSQSMET